MRLIAVPLLCLCLATHALALQGVIHDQNDRPIPFARVSVHGESGWVIADSEGKFQLPRDLKPPLTLLVSGPDGVFLGSFTFSHKLPETLVITVQRLREEVTVVAARPPDLVLAPAAAFGIVPQEELQMRQPAQLADVLDSIPNVTRLEEGHSVVPAVRGLARFRTLLILDDTRILTERRAGPSATFLDPLSIGEVEVVRGAAGVAYGSDAFGGVIAVRTRLASPGEQWSTRYHLLAATGVPERTIHVETGGALGRGALTVGLGGREFERYRTPKGTEFNSEASFRSVRVGYQLPLGSGILRALWRSDWGRDIGKPALDSRITRAYYPEENSHRLVVGFEAPLSGRWQRFGWTLSWVEYQLLTDRDRFATASSPRKLTRADVSSHDYNARVEVEGRWAGGRLVLGADAHGRFGLQATNETFTFTGASASERSREVSIADARKDDAGVFAAFSRSWNGFALNLGLRGDATRSRNRGGYFGDRTVDFARPSGFAAVTWTPAAGLETSLQFSRGFRDAVLSDRFYRGISGRGFITGNPDLKPETANQWDASVRYRQGPWGAALYAYRYEIDDYIERYRRGVDFFFRNRATVRLSGLEAEASWRSPKGVGVTVGLQYPKGQVLDDRTWADDVPPRGGFLLVTGSRGPLRWEARIAAYARDRRPGPTETLVPGYAVADFGGSYRFSESLEVGIYARNLADRAYPGSADANASLAPGRSVQVSLRGIVK